MHNILPRVYTLGIISTITCRIDDDKSASCVYGLEIHTSQVLGITFLYHMGVIMCWKVYTTTQVRLEQSVPSGLILVVKVSSGVCICAPPPFCDCMCTYIVHKCVNLLWQLSQCGIVPHYHTLGRTL